MERIILAEDDEAKRIEGGLLNDSHNVLADIKRFVEKLKSLDGKEFDEILKIIHGRFSKLELYMIDLEKLKNDTV